MRRTTTNPADLPSIEVEGGAVRCRGSWTVDLVGRVERSLSSLTWPGAGGVVIDAAGVAQMDTAGAWLLRRTASSLEQRGRPVTLRVRPEHEGLLGTVSAAADTASLAPARGGVNLVEALGRKAWSAASELGNLVSFAGEAASTGVRALAGPLRARRRQVSLHVQSAGSEALPTTALLSFSVGAVIAYQASAVLRPMGAGVLVADLVGLAMLRDLAPLLAAIIAAARSGSGYAAQIGAMKMTGELDSLRALGTSPMEILVLPRIAALAVALLLLAVAADVLGVLGGMMVARYELAIDPGEFLGRLARVVHPSDYFIGLAKAPVFGAIVATAGCFQGLHVDDHTDSVGRRTAVAVVQSVFLVIVADAYVNVLTRVLGI